MKSEFNENHFSISSINTHRRMRVGFSHYTPINLIHFVQNWHRKKHQFISLLSNIIDQRLKLILQYSMLCADIYSNVLNFCFNVYF